MELLKQTKLFKAFIFPLANIFFKRFQRNMCFKSLCLDKLSPGARGSGSGLPLRPGKHSSPPDSLERETVRRTQGNKFSMLYKRSKLLPACYRKQGISPLFFFFFFLSSKSIKPLPTEEHLSIAQQLGEGLSMGYLLNNSNGKGGPL